MGSTSWLRKVTTPFRRIWDAMMSRLLPGRRHKRANGISKLYNDVRSCGYEDVHVMWSMLQHSHFPSDPPKRRHHRLTRSLG
ncbi:unnamed protein product [Sphagnum troendelagicum]|uniref:Uncharacterized protein n=1 Tax=Sphagnum troendelagicum TaxID=128251 RepID=A0ABP0U7M2_9BRYO|nr:hypothetical protein BDL97_02G052300 [Sphagnum fallax]